MSKELKKQLRDLANCRHDDLSIGYEAADLIEAQQKRIDELERKNKQLFDEHHYQACLTHDLLPYQERAVKAEQHLAATIDILEQTRVERDEWKASAEFSYRQRDELEREIEREMSAAASVLKERDALAATEQPTIGGI